MLYENVCDSMLTIRVLSVAFMSLVVGYFNEFFYYMHALC